MPHIPTNNDSTDVIVKQSRFVTFNEIVRFKRTMPLSQYTKKEHQDCFYSRKDISRFGYTTKKLAESFDDAKESFNENPDVCLRGVERYSWDRACQIRERRRDAWDVVDANQDTDPEFMISWLLSTSIDSETEAIARGVADRLAALEAKPAKKERFTLLRRKDTRPFSLSRGSSLRQMTSIAA